MVILFSGVVVASVVVVVVASVVVVAVGLTHSVVVASVVVEAIISTGETVGVPTINCKECMAWNNISRMPPTMNHFAN